MTDGKSVDYYQIFFTLWKDADPGIAEGEDAWKNPISIVDLFIFAVILLFRTSVSGKPEGY
jgi:hypothetical protein